MKRPKKQSADRSIFISRAEEALASAVFPRNIVARGDLEEAVQALARLHGIPPRRIWSEVKEHKTAAAKLIVAMLGATEILVVQGKSPVGRPRNAARERAIIAAVNLPASGYPLVQMTEARWKAIATTLHSQSPRVSGLGGRPMSVPALRRAYKKAMERIADSYLKPISDAPDGADREQKVAAFLYS